ncbi:MAG: amino acid ABC transporter permease, partial [Gammaproteobacteria bacterium]
MIRPFGFDEILFLLESTGWTIVLTLIASLLGGALALCVALARVAVNPVARELARGYIAIVQGVPVLMLLFLSYYGLSYAGFELPPIVAASLSLAIYSSAYLGDIWRGAIQSVARQQWEASASLAMTKRQQYRYVILPQAMKIAVPPGIGFLIALVKATSLVSVITATDL